ncbi:uncharacterized protein TEOVI_000779200 [Trypanosoma equiperdum]|uniref:Uncharacterized protein n=1 Tax=Trypanosoma equiperdum TaxID=5694 RepID=A0A1G4I448_TRYEQ|nr:hypothetical protein, conserved [Trypanosoma equiperdum]
MLRASVLLLKSSIRTSGLLLPWKIRPVADTMERRDAWKELEQLLTSITRLSNEEAIEKMTEFCPRLAICDIEYPVETLQRKRRLEERRMLRQHHENRSRNGKKKGEREQVTETVTLADDEATRKLMKSTLRILVARAQKNSGTSDREVVRDKMKKSSSKIIVSSSSATPAPLPSKSDEGKRSGADKKANRGEVDGTQNSKRKGEVEKSSDLVSSPTTTTTGATAAAAAAAMNVSSSSTFPSGETPFRASSTASTAGVKGADTSSSGGSACKTGKGK